MQINIPEKIESKLEPVKPGVLYIVSTPIGNLEDISFRALNVLKNVDFVAAEDTRVTGNLLHLYGISKKIISYYSRVESTKSNYIIEELKSGKSVALVSDAGTPCISDPGNILVNECINNKIEIIAVPGASSLIHSLVSSGFDSKNFYFQGFLPQKGRENLYTDLKNKRMPIIIFESKFRIKKSIIELSKHFSGKEIFIGRELTKKFEEIIKSRINELIKNLNSVKEKGEFVIIINNK